MKRVTSWLVAAVIFSLVLFTGLSESQAARRHGKAHRGRQAASNDVTVTVLDSNGQPVAGATVHLHKAAAHARHHAPGRRHHAHAGLHARRPHRRHHHAARHAGRTAVTDAAGHATFKHVRGGRYHIGTRWPSAGRGQTHVALKGGKSGAVTVQLHKGGKHKVGKLKGHAHGKKHGKHRHAKAAPHSQNAPQT
jgi:hypothetical protein